MTQSSVDPRRRPWEHPPPSGDAAEAVPPVAQGASLLPQTTSEPEARTGSNQQELSSRGSLKENTGNQSGHKEDRGSDCGPPSRDGEEGGGHTTRGGQPRPGRKSGEAPQLPPALPSPSPNRHPRGDGRGGPIIDTQGTETQQKGKPPSRSRGMQNHHRYGGSGPPRCRDSTQADPRQYAQSTPEAHRRRSSRRRPKRKAHARAYFPPIPIQGRPGK